MGQADRAGSPRVRHRSADHQHQSRALGEGRLQRAVPFFFNDTATTEIYTLSLHDALPISAAGPQAPAVRGGRREPQDQPRRSEEHTSELQSQFHLVCRLLLEKKKQLVKFSPFFLTQNKTDISTNRKHNT